MSFDASSRTNSNRHTWQRIDAMSLWPIAIVADLRLARGTLP
jgi:hypothetical protein